MDTDDSSVLSSPPESILFMDDEEVMGPLPALEEAVVQPDIQPAPPEEGPSIVEQIEAFENMPAERLPPAATEGSSSPRPSTSSNTSKKRDLESAFPPDPPSKPPAMKKARTKSSKRWEPDFVLRDAKSPLSSADLRVSKALLPLRGNYSISVSTVLIMPL